MSFRTVPELLAAAVERYADATAVVTADASESFNQLGARVAAAADALREQGVVAGDRVLMAGTNSLALVHLWLGAIWAGAIPAAVNPQSTETEFDYFKRDLQPRLALREEDIHGFVPSPSGGGKGGGSQNPLDVAAIVYTSGTTSRPKGVMVRHAAYTESGRSFPSWFGLGPQERLWATLPFFHINAQAYSLMGTLANGYSLAISARFHASTFWQEARDLGVTSANTVGAMLEFIARQPASAWVPSSLYRIYSAPAPLPDERRRLEARFNVRIMSGYGMTENPFGCAESETSRDKPGSIGRPRQPVAASFVNALRIVQPDGRDAAEGEVGELYFQNPVMTPGYWYAPEITAATLKDGWLRTGDAGYRDRDGDVFLTGRYKEMIRRRGENIAPAEIEDVLREHEAVAAVAVFGVDQGLQEEEVVAAVVLNPGATVDAGALKAFAAVRLAPFKVPSRIAFRDSLPMTPTQRVARDLLRQEYGRDR